MKRSFAGPVLIVAMLCTVGIAFGGPAFQQTKDRRAYVWNPDYNPDEAVTWSGKHDTQHLATGEGTVTYYKIKRGHGMGVNVPEDYVPIASFSGTMVRGKLEGLVTTSTGKGETMHAKFVDGVRQSDWAPGKPSPEEIARTTAPPSSSPLGSPAGEGRSEQVESTPAPKPAIAKRAAAPQPTAVPNAPESETPAAANVSAASKSSKAAKASETAASPKAVTKAIPEAKPTVAKMTVAKPSPQPRATATIAPEPEYAAAPPSPTATGSKSKEAVGIDEPFSEPPALALPPADITSRRSAKAAPSPTAAAKEQTATAAATPSIAPSASPEASAIAAAPSPSASTAHEQPVSAQSLGEPPSQRSDYTRYLHRRTRGDPTQAFQSLSLAPQAPAGGSTSDSGSPAPSTSP